METVNIPYESYVDILSELNKAINACTNGHGNGYMWRTLSGIEANLTNHYNGSQNLFEDVKQKL